jgi:ABC-type branched-subunit amino acid transport system substrate-binding protein
MRFVELLAAVTSPRSPQGRGRALKTALPLVLLLLAGACTGHRASTGGSTPPPTVAANVKLVEAVKQSCPGAVTATCVTVGNVSTIGGVIPGLFEGAAVGTDAYLSYLDSTQGGIDGRRIALASEDDKFNGENNRSETLALVSRVIAFVGSFTLEDQDGGLILRQHPNVANVSLSLSQSTLDLPNTVSPVPAIGGWQLGPLEYFAHEYPQAVKHVGILIAQESSAEEQAHGLERAMEHLGYHISYSSEFGPLQGNFQTQLLAMQNAGVQFVDLTSMDGTDAEHIVSEMHTQGWHPLIESAGPIYVNNFVQLVGGPSVADGIYLDQDVALYLGGDSKTVPEVNTFLSWVQKVRPGFVPDLYTLYGWISGMLFAQGMEHAGKDPTSASLLASLRQVHAFDANGLIATSDPGHRGPPTCWILARIVNGVFVRIPPSPRTGYICNAGYYSG